MTNKDTRTITIVNDGATDYDWNEGGSIFRDGLIKMNNYYYNINPNKHGFKTYYYGTGRLNK